MSAIGCRTEYLYNMLPADAVIRERLFSDERKADVFAHLLAANHVLTKDSEITEEEATALAVLIACLGTSSAIHHQALRRRTMKG